MTIYKRPAIVIITLFLLAIVFTVQPWKPQILRDWENIAMIAKDPLIHPDLDYRTYITVIDPVMKADYGPDWSTSLQTAEIQQVNNQTLTVLGILGLGVLAFFTLGRSKKPTPKSLPSQ